MELLGYPNRRLPGWLDRLLPNVHAEGHDLTDEADVAVIDREPPVAAGAHWTRVIEAPAADCRFLATAASI